MRIDTGRNQNYISPYVILFEAAEKLNKSAGLQIKLFMFGKGYVIYAFSLDPETWVRGI
jgi:hypothetical protein